MTRRVELCILIKRGKSMQDIDWSTANRHLTTKGYIQLRKTVSGKSHSIMEHVLAWQLYHGDKPKGYQVHHINGNRTDNKIENLILLSPIEHVRLHAGYVMIDEIWWKRCYRCKQMKMVDEDFFGRGDTGCRRPICKECDRGKSAEYRDKQLLDNREEFKSKLKESSRKYYLSKRGDADYLARKKATQKRYLEKKKGI